MANKKFLVPLGLLSLASDPASGTEGELYYNNVSDGVRLYKNGAWTDLSSTGAIPSGGSTGQILAKSSNTDYAVEWIENYADYTETVKLRVKNDGTRALYKGQPVYVTGSDGTNVLVGRSSNVTEGGSSKTIGLLAENLATNGQGFVIKEGKLGTLDTSTAGAVGDPVWLGVDGALIYGLSNKPSAPAHLVYLGVVTKKNGSTGEIFVQVQNGFEIRELHDVGIGYAETITDNEVLAYDTTSGTWKNQTPAEAGLATSDSPIFTGSVTVGTDIGSDGAYLEITNDIQTSIKSLTNSAVVAESTGVTLNTGGGGTAKSWVFKNDGDLTFPDASNQSTAFLGISAYDTDDIAEGTNEYFTNEKAVSALATTLEDYALQSSLSSYLTTLDAENTYVRLDDIDNIVGEYIPLSEKGTAQGVAELDIDGYVPASQLNLSSYLTSSAASSTYQPVDADLTAIAALLGTSGFLKKTDTNTWTLDTNTYLTTSSASSTYQPIGNYASDTHNHTLNSLSNVVITGTPTDGQAIVWDTTTSKWVNETVSGGASYPDQTGNNGKFLQTNGASVSWQNVDFSDYAPILNPVFISDIQVDGQINLLMDGTTPTSYLNSSYNPFTESSYTTLLGRMVSIETDVVGDQYSKVFLEIGGASLQALGTGSKVVIAGDDGEYLNFPATNNQIATIGDLTLETITDGGATSSNAITISNTTQSTTPTSGALIISGGVGIAKDVWIDGDLHVNGTTVTENTKTVATHDNLIYLNAAQDSTITNAVGDGTYVTYTADNDYTVGMDIRVTGMNPSGYNISSADGLTIYSATSTQFVVEKIDTGSFVSGGTAHAKEEANPDLGFAGGYYDAGYAHAGLFRDASDGVFKFFQGYTPEPDEAVNIDTTHASFSLAPISAAGLKLYERQEFSYQDGGEDFFSYQEINHLHNLYNGVEYYRYALDNLTTSLPFYNITSTFGRTSNSNSVLIEEYNGYDSTHSYVLNSHSLSSTTIIRQKDNWTPAGGVGSLIGKVGIEMLDYQNITIYGTLNLENALSHTEGGTGLTTLGTAGSILRVNSGATGLEYTNSPTFNTVTTGEAITKTTSTSLTSGSPITIATFSVPYGSCIVAECTILISSTSNGSYTSSKILITADPDFNATADITEYAVMQNNDSSLNPAFTATISGTTLSLKATVENWTATTAKVISTSILSPMGAA